MEDVLKVNEVIETTDLSEMDGKYLTFWVAEQLLAVPISNVVQIVGIGRITPMPDYPVYCKGIIHWRENVVPIIDVAIRFHRAEKEYTDRTCVIILNISDRYFGLIVDEMDEVLYIAAERISPPVQMSEGVSANYIAGIVHMDDKNAKDVILCLNAEMVIGETFF